MIRRQAFLLLTPTMLVGCTPFKIGWKLGGLCNDDAIREIDISYKKSEISFVNLLKWSKIRAETVTKSATNSGLVPRPGAVVAQALSEAEDLLALMRKANFKVTHTDTSDSEIRSVLCTSYCGDSATNCDWRPEFSRRIAELESKGVTK